jgi:hypothetical protein
MDVTADEIEAAIEDMGPWHEDHAGTDRHEPQRGAEPVMDRQRTDDARQEGRTERLKKDVFTYVRQAATQEGAHTGTPGDQGHCSKMMQPDSVERTQGHSPSCRCDRKDPGLDGSRVRDGLDFAARLLGLETAGSDVVDHSQYRGNAIHFNAGWFGAFETDDSPVGGFHLQRKLAPARQQPGAQAESFRESCCRSDRPLRRLAIDKQSLRGGEDKGGAFFDHSPRTITSACSTFVAFLRTGSSLN